MKHHIMKRQIRHSLWLSAILAFAIIATWASNAFAQMTTLVKIVPNEASINVGQTIEVTVQVENIVNLYGIEMLIIFDPNLLEVVDADPSRPGTQIAPGEFLRGGFEGANTVTGGAIDYAMQQVSPNPPSSGSGVLARIVFRGIGSGVANIRIDDLNPYNQDEQGIGSGIESAQITIQAGNVDVPAATPISPTPVPPTPVPPTPVPPTPVPPTPVPPTPTSAPPTPVPQATVAVQPVAAESLGVNCAAIRGYHIVQRGETLYAIARAYAANPYAIVACNPTINPRRIHASNHLAIPYAPWTPPPGPTAARQFGPSLIPAPVPTPAPGCRARHVVQFGETLTAIGLRYNANIWEIARANRIYNLHLINSGQVLCIP